MLENIALGDGERVDGLDRVRRWPWRSRRGATGVVAHHNNTVICMSDETVK